MSLSFPRSFATSLTGLVGHRIRVERAMASPSSLTAFLVGWTTALDHLRRKWREALNNQY